jgi:hypothetical protein
MAFLLDLDNWEEATYTLAEARMKHPFAFVPSLATFPILYEREEDMDSFDRRWKTFGPACVSHRIPIGQRAKQCPFHVAPRMPKMAQPPKEQQLWPIESTPTARDLTQQLMSEKLPLIAKAHVASCRQRSEWLTIVHMEWCMM